MRVQIAQSVSVLTFNIIKLKNCYDCHQFDHRIKNCSKILKLINNDFIHFNEQKKMCFDRKEQKNVEMRLMYKLFKIETARVCLQQQTKMQNIVMKIKVINIIKKLFKFENEIDDEKEVHDENMLMKIWVARQEIDSFRWKIFWKFFLKQSARVLKNKKQKEVNLLTIKNVWNDNYFNAINLAEQAISIDDIEMIKMIVEVNFKFCATKYQKVKQIKFKISFETFKTFEKLKRFAQVFKKQSNSVDIMK